MVVVRWLGMRRFNWIDIVTIWAVVQASEAENLWLAGLVFGVGVILSTLAERVAKVPA